MTPNTSAGAPSAETRIPPELVRESLDRVLASAAFRGSLRAKSFLRHVVEATLNGNGAALKERTIGMEALGRGPAFEPADDSTVRVTAGDVRRRLAHYYGGQQSPEDRVVLELPVGSYVPQFSIREHEAVAVPVPVPAHAQPQTHTRRWGIGVAIAAACVFAAALFLLRRPSLAGSLQQFWKPVLESNAPALVQVAPVPVYVLRQFESKPVVELKDFLENRSQYVDVGDLKAQSRIADLLSRARRAPRIRIDNSVGFEDLKNGPSILVGYSYDRWSELGRGLRFYLSPGTNDFFGVMDNGARTPWCIHHPDDPDLSEDYAIVSRVFDRDTGQVLVLVSGISRYGTQAAAQLVTNAELLGQALQKAPKGWADKNLEIVLRVRIVAQTPANPIVVATHFW